MQVKKKANPYCRWLHLSDLHLLNKAEDSVGREVILYGSKGESLSGEAKNIDEGGLKWYVTQYPVDCIIITGDFFFRGNFDEKTRKGLKLFLQELYRICSDAAEWGWNETNGMDRLFWCPGNHDLDRSAVLLEKNILIRRDEAIGRVNEEGYFFPGNSRSLLTTQSFSTVYEFMRELRGETADENVYEAQLYQVPKLNKPPVYFLAINTALSAGQLVQDEVDDKVEKAYETFFKCHNLHDSAGALRAYEDYHKHLQIKKRKVIDDEGKICFVSEECVNALKSELATKGKYIAILIGHHPYGFFEKKAQLQFKKFTQSSGIKLYLHGHTHILQNDAPFGNRFLY